MTSTVLAALTFSPAIATAWWHLRHGSQVGYRGAHFAVPARWSARIRPTAIYFDKRPLTIYSDSVRLAWAAMAPVPNPPRTRVEREAFYANFSAIYSRYLLRAQEIQEDSIRLGAGEGEAFCLQSVLKERRDWFHVTCLIFRGSWSVDFQGGPADKVEFFHKVLGLPDTQALETHSNPDAHVK